MDDNSIPGALAIREVVLAIASVVTTAAVVTSPILFNTVVTPGSERITSLLSALNVSLA